MAVRDKSASFIRLRELAFYLIFLAFTGGRLQAAEPQLHSATGPLDEFLVLYSIGWGHPNTEWPRNEPDIDRLAASIKAAGFNVVTGTWQDGRTLPILKRHGLRLLVDLHGDPTYRPREHPEAAQKLCESLGGEPGVWGYFLFDGNANEKQARRLSQTINDVRRWDPTHRAYVNVFRDGYKFAPLLEHPNVLSYHYYQWWYGLHGTGFYERLEKMRAIAQSKNCPLILWQAVALETDENVPRLRASADTIYHSGDDNRLRHGVYSALAYGAQGIEWFLATALTDPAKREFIVPNGAASGPYRLIEPANLTRAGHDVLTINRELKRLGPILVSLRNVAVYHTSDSRDRLPAETRGVPPDHWVQAHGGEAAVGIFKDSEGSDYLFVANRRVHDQQTVTLQFAAPIKQADQFDRRHGGWKAVNLTAGDKPELRLDLAPGDGELLRVEKR